jgi:glycosyltransferase involved in cell wall biosynthesis
MAATSSLYSVLGIGLSEKVEIVYPAIKAQKIRRKRGGKIRILFVGRNFIGKGGRELLAAFARLTKKYDDVELLVKSHIPPSVMAEVKKCDNILFSTEIVSRQKLFEKYYLTSHIFVLPTYTDTFGYVLLEAMSVGLPVVATDIFAIPEIVEDGKNGFLIRSPIRWHDERWLHCPQGGSKRNRKFVIDQLVEKISLLIEEPQLRIRMGRYGRRLVERGKFSIKERNKKLLNIYEEAIRW